MVQSKGKEIEIKEEPSVPPEIFEAASSGKLVLFIGAGVSRIIGCSSWENFALQQLEDLREKKAINYHEYSNLKSLDARKLLSICRSIYRKNNIEPPSMKSLLKGKEELIKKFKIYDDIYAFNAIYITTNYDSYGFILSSVAAHCRRADYCPGCYHSGSDFGFTERPAEQVWHVHTSDHP